MHFTSTGLPALIFVLENHILGIWATNWSKLYQNVWRYQLMNVSSSWDLSEGVHLEDIVNLLILKALLKPQARPKMCSVVLYKILHRKQMPWWLTLSWPENLKPREIQKSSNLCFVAEPKCIRSIFTTHGAMRSQIKRQSTISKQARWFHFDKKKDYLSRFHYGPRSSFFW